MKNQPIRNLITRGICATFVAATAFVAISLQAADFKHVAVPPESIDAQQMKQANKKGLFSHSTMLPIYAKSASIVDINSQTFSQKLYLDGTNNSSVVLMTPDADNWFMSVSNPNGKMVYDELASTAKALLSEDIKVGPQTFKGKQLLIENPVKGEWTVKLTHKGKAASLIANSKTQQGRADNDVAAYLLHKGDSEFQLYSYLDNNFTTLNSDINLIAYMVDSTLDRGERQKMLKKEAIVGTIDQAIASIKSPSGALFKIRLNDDGVNGDKVANDGQFGGKIPSNEVGVYTNQLQIEGTRPDGKPFSRTTTDIYPVAAVSFEFANRSAQINLLSDTSAVLSVPVKNLNNSDSVFMSAELWGTNSDGKLVSAAWIGGIVTPKNANKNTMLDLSFDTRWLTRAKLIAPFTLKSLRMQNVENNVPIAQRDEMSTRSMLPSQLFESTLARDINRTITRDMLMGKAPERKGVVTTKLGSGSKLLLVHGYCSGQAWNTGHFSGATEFKDYNVSISHDTFAQRVINFGAPYNSYGIVAHSQGGAAALTMFARYWTGLDNATGGRLIQSVGTPYQGTALAGNLAALGDVFGVGCGTNTDLTYSGSSNWLATIPTWARNEVDYYTTSFEDKWYRYDYCHLATDLFLDDPEDGTTEKWSGQLVGGTNKGHKTGQCHTASMRDPSQTADTSRNSIMNSNAAR